MISTMEKVNSRNDITELFVDSTDVRALYPSLLAGPTVAIVVEAFLETNIKVEGINWPEAGKYLAINLSKEEVVTLGLAELVSTRTKTRGACPGNTTAELMGKLYREEESSLFHPPRREPATEEERKKVERRRRVRSLLPAPLETREEEARRRSPSSRSPCSRRHRRRRRRRGKVVGRRRRALLLLLLLRRRQNPRLLRKQLLLLLLRRRQLQHRCRPHLLLLVVQSTWGSSSLAPTAETPRPTSRRRERRK